MMAPIGFIGLGAIGLPIARHLARDGQAMCVFDPRPDAQEAMPPHVQRVGSPKDVGDRSQIVWSCLVSEEIHRDALRGPQGLAYGAMVRTHVQLGTTGPALVRELDEALRPHGIAYVDAPITGSVIRAEAGTLTSLVACPRSLLESLRPFLDRYSKEAIWLGDKPGAAQVAKLVNNAVSFANLASACEALIVGAKEGLDPASLVQALNSGTGQNSATLIKIPREILTGNFDVGGALRIALKDMNAYLDLARESGVSVPVGEMVMRCYEQAASASSLDADVSTVIRPMEIEAGVELRSRN